MFSALRLLAGLGLVTIIVMSGFGLDPKRTRGELLPQVAFFAAGGFVMIGLLAGLFEMVFANGRKVESKGIDGTVAPDREFDYRRRRTHASIAFVFAGLFAAPLLVVWPLMLLVGEKEATHPGMIGLFVFVFLTAVVLFVIGRRMWSARVFLYPDRLAVRGIYSNGSLRWDVAREFAHVEVPAGEWNTMWVYYLIGDTHSVRVECTVASPDEFVREVESRTGLRLEKHPVGWEPKPKSVHRRHTAFRG